MGKHRPFGIMALGVAVLNVLLAIVFVKGGELGLWGVAMAQSLCYGLVGLVFIPFYLSRELKLPLNVHLWNVLGRTLLVGTPFVVLVAIMQFYYFPASLSALALVCAASALFLLPCYWLWGVKEQERVQLRAMVKWATAYINTNKEN
jgi:Na+-driven multidrug efflux pump